jgi:hypothetical protein
LGTFHHDKGELHGITVVVDTRDGRVFVGRCDSVRPDGVVLLDGDVYDERVQDARGERIPKADWLQRAARFGVWKRYERVLVPQEDVASVRRLGSL